MRASRRNVSKKLLAPSVRSLTWWAGGEGEGSFKSAVLDLCLGWENSTLGKWISILVVEAMQSVVLIVAHRQVGLRLLNLSIDPPRCTGISTIIARPSLRLFRSFIPASEFISGADMKSTINRIRSIIRSCDSVRFVIRINFLLSIPSLNDLSLIQKYFQCHERLH